MVGVAPFRWHVTAFGLAALLLTTHSVALDGLEEPAAPTGVEDLTVTTEDPGDDGRVARHPTGLGRGDGGAVGLVVAQGGDAEVLAELLQADDHVDGGGVATVARQGGRVD